MVKCGLKLQKYEEFIVLVLYIHVSHLLFKREHGSGDTCSCISAHDTGAVHSFFLGPRSTRASIQTLLLLIPVRENAVFATARLQTHRPMKICTTSW